MGGTVMSATTATADLFARGIAVAPPGQARALRPAVLIRAAARPAVFDLAAGELHHDGQCTALTPQLAALLATLMRAEGRIVPTAEVAAMTRALVPYSDRHVARRQLVERLRKAIAPVGLDVEHRLGFGYRLHGAVQFRGYGQL